MDIDLLRKLIDNQENYEDFLNFAEEFDKQKEISGVGAIFAGGLLLSAMKKRE